MRERLDRAEQSRAEQRTAEWGWSDAHSQTCNAVHRKVYRQEAHTHNSTHTHTCASAHTHTHTHTPTHTHTHTHRMHTVAHTGPILSTPTQAHKLHQGLSPSIPSTRSVHMLKFSLH